MSWPPSRLAMGVVYQVTDLQEQVTYLLTQCAVVLGEAAAPTPGDPS